PERPVELGGETIERGLAAPAIVRAPAPGVARLAATKHDPVVSGQTKVVEDPPRIEDALAPLPPQRVEDLRREWGGDNHLQVNRQDAAAQEAELRRVAGRRHHDIVRHHITPTFEGEMHGPAPAKSGDARALEDRAAAGHHSLAEPGKE